MYKSGLEAPGDYPFEDFTQGTTRPRGSTGSDCNPAVLKMDGVTSDGKQIMSKTKNKLRLFGKKPVKNSVCGIQKTIPAISTCKTDMHGRISVQSILKHQVKRAVATFPFTSQTLEDYNNLPPEQRRRKLQQRLCELKKELQKELDQRYLGTEADANLSYKFVWNQPIRISFGTDKSYDWSSQKEAHKWQVSKCLFKQG